MRSPLWFAGTRVVVHVAAADSSGRVGVWESEEPRGTALPLHVHSNEDEQMVVLEGEVSVRLGEETHRLGAGETLALPRGVPHARRVDSQIARILTIATPGGFEALFLEHGTTGDAPPPRPPDEVLVAAVGKLGVQPVGRFVNRRHPDAYGRQERRTVRGTRPARSGTGCRCLARRIVDDTGRTGPSLKGSPHGTARAAACGRPSRHLLAEGPR